MKTRIITLLLITIIALSSCKKGFLDETPYSFISSSALYNSASGAEAAINGCWGICANYGGYGAGYITIMTVGSGGFYTNQAPNSDMNTLTHGASTLWLTNNSPWDNFYSAIKVANDIIVNLPKGGAPDSVKTRIVGEAYFMRGMLYFNLVRMFGGVPLRTVPVSQDDVNMPRATADAVYALIISDLEKAKTMMPVPGSQIKGRPHRMAAYALLGKVYLTLAGNDQPSPYWQKAKTELLAVVNSNAYSLVPNFANLFDVANENTTESIIEVQYGITGDPNGQLTNFFTPGSSTYTPLAQNGPFGRIRVNKELIDSHRIVYPLDPRRKATYIDSQYTRNDGVIQKIWPTQKTGANSFAYIKKYVDPNYVATNSNKNFIYLRYADVLLMLAECENEINGPATAYQYVNQVLARARNTSTPASTMPADWSGMTQADFRGRIMLERRFELIGEGHLYYDVRRRGVAAFQTFLDRHNTYPANLTSNIDVKYVLPTTLRTMLLPIPQKEIDANSMIEPADQNPGY